jgi:hypothetical protein
MYYKLIMNNNKYYVQVSIAGCFGIMIINNSSIPVDSDFCHNFNSVSYGRGQNIYTLFNRGHEVTEISALTKCFKHTDHGYSVNC